MPAPTAVSSEPTPAPTSTIPGFGYFLPTSAPSNLTIINSRFAPSTPTTAPPPAPSNDAPSSSPGSNPVVTATCISKLSPTQVAAGISAVEDALCVNNGLGCFDRVCRLCKVWDTAESASFAAYPINAASS
uniref:Uncharacterized protein n=1 Tax=Globisporangium ultimum (strain ATCC 200006 / CBS 805.95 / DAOM BR144) TaxID=431595 RepID=K3W7B5_GLOUD